MKNAAPRKFEYPVTVTEKDIDEMGHANNVVYLRWVQEAAAAHWNHIASPGLKKHYAWVVVRHEIDYLQPAFLHDKIIAYTWVGEHSGATSERYVEIYNADTGKKLASAKTTWCLLDAISLRPKRIEAEIHSVFK
jgi:acyl-CoA thioester hydrolase